MTIKFVVPGEPKAKARTRAIPMKRCTSCGKTHCRRQCTCGSYEGTFVTNIQQTPKDTVLYENLVAMCAREAASGHVFAGGLRLTARFYFAVPKTRAKKLVEGQPHLQRPDVDNCLKSILDGCNTVLWGDDCAVAAVAASKHWTHGAARAEVEVEGE